MGLRPWLGSEFLRQRGIGQARHDVCVVPDSERSEYLNISHVFHQKGVALFHAGDTSQPHLFDQPVLQGLIGSLNPPFGLGELALMPSISSVFKARPNWVSCSPEAAYSALTVKMLCLFK